MKTDNIMVSPSHKDVSTRLTVLDACAKSVINLSSTAVSGKSLHINGSSAHITLMAKPGPRINKNRSGYTALSLEIFHTLK